MKALTVLALVLAATTAHAGDNDRRRDADVNYVGAGRYHCTGDSATCALVRQGNENLEANRRLEREGREARRAERERDSWAADRRLLNEDRDRPGRWR